MEHLRTQARQARRNLASMHPAERRAALVALAACSVALIAMLAVAVYFWRLSVKFPQAPFRQPSRLYGAPTRLAAGASYSPDDLVAELEAAGYREAPGAGPLPRGTFRQGNPVKAGESESKAGAKTTKKKEEKKGKDGKEDSEDKDKDGDRQEPKPAGDVVAVHLRRFRTPHGEQGGVPVEVAFARGRVAALYVAGRPAGEVELEPPLLASFYGPEVNERRPVRLADLPDDVVRSVLAAEDDAFFVHPGVSVAGIVRAAWSNARDGGVQQGGSTITQQLVKNVYLTQERTFSRKAKEAVMAVLLEMRHGKRAILEAYLNEIYWGRSGPANLIGLGAASRAYFGKDPDALTLAEAATLAGMIRAPSETSPVEHPEKARERRDYVLHRLADLGWVERARVEAALAQPVRTDPQTVVARRLAPYFSEAAAAEAHDRFGLDELADEGYQLFATVTWRDQRQAEAAVDSGLARLAPARRKGRALEAALLSLDPRDGAILAYVGGRDYAKSQFDRVSQAHRQAGSAFKPVVYAAAFSEGIATPATLLRDSPIVVRVSNQSWRPQNNDRSFHGTVTVRRALEQSLNVPAVRVALQSGLSQVIDVARRMGIASRLEPMPSLALGAFGVTPRELAEVYATLASGGLKPPVHGLAAVFDRGGEPVEEESPAGPVRVLDAQAAYLVTSILQGVIEHGTGQGARAAGVRDLLAGKTGTTNGRRDSWFAGYSADRVTVVWVGYDDNAPTRLSGASAALPIWGRFTRAVRPAGGFAELRPPPGVVTATIDPATGMLATDLCPQAVAEVFPEWDAPTQPCTLHGQGGEPWMQAQTGAEGYSGYGYEDGQYGGEAGDGFDPRYAQPGDPGMGGAADTAGTGEVEVDTSRWNDPAQTPSEAGGESWRQRPLHLPEGDQASEPGTIVIRPTRRPAPAPEAPAALDPVAEPSAEDRPAGGAEAAAPADPDADWGSSQESEDWSDQEAATPPPPPAH